MASGVVVLAVFGHQKIKFGISVPFINTRRSGQRGLILQPVLGSWADVGRGNSAAATVLMLQVRSIAVSTEDLELARATFSGHVGEGRTGRAKAVKLGARVSRLMTGPRWAGTPADSVIIIMIVVQIVR